MCYLLMFVNLGLTQNAVEKKHPMNISFLGSYSLSEESRLVGADRKATVMQIISLYKQSISDHIDQWYRWATAGDCCTYNYITRSLHFDHIWFHSVSQVDTGLCKADVWRLGEKKISPGLMNLCFRWSECGIHVGIHESDLSWGISWYWWFNVGWILATHLDNSF